MPRAIVVTSGKGGVGKTTLTAALGKVLAENGQRTVLLDADIGLNNLDVLMNVENRITFDITAAGRGRRSSKIRSRADCSCCPARTDTIRAP